MKYFFKKQHKMPFFVFFAQIWAKVNFLQICPLIKSKEIFCVLLISEGF